MAAASAHGQRKVVKGLTLLIFFRHSRDFGSSESGRKRPPEQRARFECTASGARSRSEGCRRPGLPLNTNRPTRKGVVACCQFKKARDEKRQTATQKSDHEVVFMVLFIT